MKVILFETIESLGRPGDIVEVKAGYFRNYLSPRGLCQLATPGNLKKLSAKRKHLEAQAANQMDEAKTRAESLEGTEIEFTMRSDEKDHLYGSIGVADIDKKLAEADIDVARRDILLPNPIKTLGVHEVDIRLHPSVSVQVKITIVKSEE